MNNIVLIVWGSVFKATKIIQIKSNKTNSTELQRSPPGGRAMTSSFVYLASTQIRTRKRTWYLVSLISATEKAGSVWTVGPNAYQINKQMKFPLGKNKVLRIE